MNFILPEQAGSSNFKSHPGTALWDKFASWVSDITKDTLYFKMFTERNCIGTALDMVLRIPIP